MKDAVLDDGGLQPLDSANLGFIQASNARCS